SNSKSLPSGSATGATEPALSSTASRSAAAEREAETIGSTIPRRCDNYKGVIPPGEPGRRAVQARGAPALTQVLPEPVDHRLVGGGGLGLVVVGASVVHECVVHARERLDLVGQ